MDKSKRVELVNLILDYAGVNRAIGLDPSLDCLYEKDELLLSQILDIVLYEEL